MILVELQKVTTRKQIINILGLVMLFLAVTKNQSKPRKEGLVLLTVSWVHSIMVLAGRSVRHWSYYICSSKQGKISTDVQLTLSFSFGP